MPKRSRSRWIRRILVFVFVGIPALTVVLTGLTLFVPLASVTEKPLGYQSFTNQYPDRIPGLPPTASTIHLAASSVGLGGRAHLYRFDAPISECVAFGEGLIATNGMTKARRDSLSIPLRTDFTNSPAPVDIQFLSAYGIGDIDWFDVETITNGFHGFGPPRGLGLVWVDAGRGRVYYYWTD